MDIIATAGGGSVGMDFKFSHPIAGPDWSEVLGVDRKPTLLYNNKESKIYQFEVLKVAFSGSHHGCHICSVFFFFFF